MRRTAAASVALLTALLGLGLATGASSQEVTPGLSRAELLELAEVEAPPAGIGLRVHADFPGEAPYMLDGIPVTSLTAEITPAGLVVMRQFLATTETTGGDKVDQCTDPTFVPTGASWREEDLPMRWHVRMRSIPTGLNKDRTVWRLRTAHQAWRDAYNKCNEPDRVKFNFMYEGKTRRSVKFDHRNVIEFDRMKSNALALSYTWYSGTRLLDADLRFNKAYNWTNILGHGWQYQVLEVATHEIGHHIGLDDLGDPHGALTMFGRIGKGDLRKTSLGRGDIRGGATLSP